MSPATMGELAKLPRIVGVKDATGDITRVSKQRATCGADFVQLSGEDASALGFNAHGGVGCISVTANVAPRLCAEFQAATLEGDYRTALDYQDRLMPLHEAIFLEPGLAGAKVRPVAARPLFRGGAAAARGPDRRHEGRHPRRDAPRRHPELI
jgi:4-hydroxy-tetrahydrodipicolinate synthase